MSSDENKTTSNLDPIVSDPDVSDPTVTPELRDMLQAFLWRRSQVLSAKCKHMGLWVTICKDAQQVYRRIQEKKLVLPSVLQTYFSMVYTLKNPKMQTKDPRRSYTSYERMGYSSDEAQAALAFMRDL